MTLLDILSIGLIPLFFLTIGISFLILASIELGLFEFNFDKLLDELEETYSGIISIPGKLKNSILSHFKDRSDDHIKTYCYLIASVVKADGKIDVNERKKVNEYINENFAQKAELAKTYLNTFLYDRTNNIPHINEEFIKTTHYADRYALVEMLFSIAVLNYFNVQKEFQSNKGRKDESKNNKVEAVLLSIMNQLGINEKDFTYLTNKYNIGNTKKEKKDGKRKYTTYENVEQKKAYQQQREESRQQRQQDAAEQKRKNLQYAYAVLGLSTSASTEEVYAAYKELAKKYHPDTVQDDFLKKQLTEKFKEISWAYHLLKQY